MNTVSFLGMGAMGSRMAANLLKSGYTVTVWNRTPAAAEPLVAAGARLAATPREAAQSSDIVISMVRDNEASREVWLDEQNGALAGMRKDSVAIESSTLTAEWIKTLAGKMAARNIAFLEAPVSGSRPQAQMATLVWFIGGDSRLVSTLKPLFEAMGSAVYHTGSHGSAALTKLATNTLMGVQVTAIAEIIGLLERENMDAAHILKAVAGTACWSPLAGGASASMLMGQFSPQFPAALIEKDFGYFLPEQADAPTLKAARSVFRQAMDNGIGGDNMTGVVRLFTR